MWQWHSLELPSFFFTNNTGAPHGDALGLIKFFSSRSSIFFFNFANSTDAIRYNAIDTRPAPEMRSMVKYTSAYFSTTRIRIICSTMLFFSVWATIIKQVALVAISFTAWLDDISFNPAASENTTPRCLQLMTTWLLDNQSIPKITSRPSIGRQMRFTLNLRPATSIGHPTQTKLVDTSPDAGVATINLQPSSRIISPSLLTHSLDTNEWVAPESYNTTTLLPKSK